MVSDMSSPTASSNGNGETTLIGQRQQKQAQPSREPSPASTANHNHQSVPPPSPPPRVISPPPRVISTLPIWIVYIIACGLVALVYRLTPDSPDRFPTSLIKHVAPSHSSPHDLMFLFDYSVMVVLIAPIQLAGFLVSRHNLLSQQAAMAPETYRRRVLSDSSQGPWWREGKRRFEVFVGCVIAIQLAVTVGFKAERVRETGNVYEMLWLMQPCYTVQLAALIVLFAPHSFLAPLASLITYCWWFGTFSAWPLADPADYTLPGERLNFHVQHVILCLVPVYCMWSGAAKADLTNKLAYAEEGHFLYALAHIFLYGPIGYLTGINIQSFYQPRGMLTQYGRYYRHLHVVFCILGVLIFGILVPLVAKRIGRESRRRRSRGVSVKRE